MTQLIHSEGLIIVLSGFSGAGKGTIMKHLLKAYPDDYHLSISATTRTRREGEEDGREYFFRTPEEFTQMIEEGAFLEYASFNGNYYGTPKAYVEELIREGKDVVLEIEVQGALQIKKLYPSALLLFVTPPSAASLKERLMGRGTEDAKAISERLAISAREALMMKEYDYLIINDQVSAAVSQMHMIIQSEHLAIERNREAIFLMQKDVGQFAKGEK